MTLPDWAVKFVRRVMGLQPGVWLIVLTVGEVGHVWTVSELGKVEK